MTSTPIETVLGRLEGAHRNGDNAWAARCPAHEDSEPSLSVGTGDDGRVLVRCHAGCATEDIVATLGLRLADLFPPKPKGDGRRITDTYPYVDEAGNLLFEVVRFEPKDFRQRRPDGNGGWTWSLAGTRRVLYRLPQVLAAVEAGTDVWLVEGEKDVAALEREGEVATTVPGGAGKWRPAYAEALAGSSVTIVADHDEPGHRHAREMAEALAGTAASVTVVQPPPPAKDVADHLGRGGTLAELVQLDDAKRAGHEDDDDGADDWDDPQPLGRTRPLPTFPTDRLPTWLRAYVEALAEATQTPPDLPGMLALSALAAAAGGRCIVEVRPGWVEPTNLHVAVAMPPGSRKSAVFRSITGPLSTVERELIEGAKADIIRATVDKQAADDRAQAAQKKAGHPEAESGAAQEAFLAAQEAEAITVPTLPRLLADDATPEALAGILAEQGGRVAVLSPEGGVFDLMAGRYSQLPNLDVYLKGHAGDALRVDRRGRDPEYVEHPAVTLGLAVQPGVLHAIADRPGFRGRGVLARILYALPASNIGARQIAPPPVPNDVADAYDTELGVLVRSLAEWTDPVALVFTPEANTRLIALERALEARMGPEGDLGHLADWAAKLAGATARIAALLHLASERAAWAKAVEATTVDDAAALAEYLADHALAAFEYMGSDGTLADARAVATWAVSRDEATFTRRDAHRAHEARFAKATDLDPVLDLLEDRGWIRRRPDPEPSSKGGRPPSPTYDVHPQPPPTEPTQPTEPPP